MAFRRLVDHVGYHKGASFMVETWAAITFHPRSGKRTHVWL